MRRVNTCIGSPIERVEDLRFLRGRGQYRRRSRPRRASGTPRSCAARSPMAASASIDAARRSRCRACRRCSPRAISGRTIPTIPFRRPNPTIAPYAQPVIARRGGALRGRAGGDGARRQRGARRRCRAGGGARHRAPAAGDDHRASAQGRRAAVRGHGQQLRERVHGRARATSTQAFRDAPYTRREQFRVQRMTAMPMETRGLLAEWDAAAGSSRVSGAAKLPFFNRRAMASMMGLPEEAVDYIEYDVGGGFGARGEFYPEDFLVAFAARKFGHPVKWVEDRREHFMAIAHSRETEMRPRDRARPRRHDPRPARRHLVRHRRLCAAERHDAGAQCRAVHLRALSRPQHRASTRMRW